MTRMTGWTMRGSRERTARVRVAHVSDQHLGVRQFSRSSPTGANARETDVARAFAAAISGIIAARPDLVLCTGDLFHAVRPPNTAVVFAFEQFTRLRQALPETPVVLISGNHDAPRSSDAGSILRLFQSAGLDVALDRAQWFRYPKLDCAVLAVPHPALVSADRRAMRPDGSERYQVLCLHGEVAGVFQTHGEYDGAVVEAAELAEGWSYVALGHYHVQHQVSPRVWYAGALDYVSPNLWGELAEEAERGVRGKGWLLADLDSGAVERRCVPQARPIYDLEPIHAIGLTAEEVMAEMAQRVASIPGGIEGAIVCLRVLVVDRAVSKQLDFAAIRRWKAEALHFRLDIQKASHTPRPLREARQRQTVQEIVADYLARRDLPPGMDRSEFVRVGTAIMDEEYGA